MERILKVKIFAPKPAGLLVGFDPKSTMKGANFVIGYVEGNQAVLQDQFGVSSFRRTSLTWNWAEKMISWKSRLSFSPTARSSVSPFPWIPGDPYDKKLEAGKTYPIILAYGKTTDLAKRHAKKYSAELKF